jgi:hypothetical protein
LFEIRGTPVGTQSLDFALADNVAGRGNGIVFNAFHNAIRIY